MNNFLQDLRYAMRQLGNHRGFTLIAVLTLGLGIGANTAIFSIVNGVLLNPLPFPNADRIVSMFQEVTDFPKGSISYPNFLDWQRENHSFAAIAAYRWGDGSITGVGQAEHVQARRVSANFFPILGVNPILGRNFTPDEDRQGANPTAIISEGLWRRKFGSDPRVIGRRIIVSGEGRSIIGVIPSSFRLIIQNFRTADLYEPIAEETDLAFFKRDSFWGTDAIGLLKPGVTLQQAREDMKAVNAGLATAYPDVDANLKANIIPLKDEIVGDMRPVLLVLLGAVAFVLLIACVNVANLLLARATARQREFSLRVALGAGQARIVRQVLTESLLLSLIGGALGLVLAKWGTAAAIAAVPASSFSSTVPRADEIGLDVRVLLFTLSVSVITGIIFGLVPALKTSRASMAETLKGVGRTISASRSRAKSMFVISEMAMAFVLLVGAGLMLRTLIHLWGVDPGFDPHQVLSFFITPPPSLADQPPDSIRAALRQIESTISTVPGVESVTLRSGAELMDSDSEITFLSEGQQMPARKADLPSSLNYVVGPQYLKTMRIPLLSGRFISEQDDEHSPRVVVIDNHFAQRYFPGQNPIGKRVSVLLYDSDPNQRIWVPLTVVGVVGHVSQFGLSDDAAHPLQAQMYRSLMQGSDHYMKDFAHGIGIYARFRSSVSPGALFQTISKKLTSTNDQMIVRDNESEDEIVAQSIASQRFSLLLLGVFAALAVLLAGIGIYGVISYLVGQRTREIGVRMALGAQRFDVLRMVVNDGARMTCAGAAIGLVAALGLTRAMANMLFGVKPTDPITFVAVAIVLCAIGLSACYLPARRAAKLDPIEALRYE